MNTTLAPRTVPILPQSIGQWRAIYWEPVMMTGERICVGFVTNWQNHSEAVLTIRPDLLSVLFGGAGQKAHQLLERTIRILNVRLSNSDEIENVTTHLSGIYFGNTEICHANSHADLLQVGKLMSSSLSTLAEPDSPDAADTIDSQPENSLPNRQFATRIKDLAITRNVNLAGYFNKEASLLSTRRTVRFGFLSNSLAAHFGLLQPTNMQRHVRNARGLIAELALAHRASGRNGLLVLGFPPLESATLTDKERSALSDYVEELSLESIEFKVKFVPTDNDVVACDALLAEA